MPFLSLDVWHYQCFAQDFQFEFILWQFYCASQWSCGLAEFCRRTAPPAKPVSKFTLLLDTPLLITSMSQFRYIQLKYPRAKKSLSSIPMQIQEVYIFLYYFANICQFAWHVWFVMCHNQFSRKICQSSSEDSFFLSFFQFVLDIFYFNNCFKDFRICGSHIRTKIRKFTVYKLYDNNYIIRFMKDIKMCRTAAGM